MKRFFVVLQYELLNYLKNKSYLITTILVAVVAGVIMFLPSIFDMPEMLGTGSGTDTEQTDGNNNADVDEADKDLMLIYDKTGIFTDIAMLDEAFPDAKWEKAASEADLKQKVEEENAEAGFVVETFTSFTYYVHNKKMTDSNKEIFYSVLLTMNRIKYCQENNIDYAQITAAFNPEITSEVSVLGKDMESNYFYCYFLVIIIFMIIVLYGAMIATSVTQEKSNRTIEVLVTSVDTNCLFFGKVFAGAIAALFQCAVVMGTVLIGYKLNQDAWGGMLDMLLDIPGEVVLTFATFGIGGFIFYIFIYGAMGALVSKTEDINKSAGGVQMIIMIVYFVVLFQLTNVDGILIKVASFLPISSYSAMFARVAMGNVAIWEVVLSFVILVASIVGVGFIGAKIYRMGTLRYGNPIKLTNALKSLKQKD